MAVGGAACGCVGWGGVGGGSCVAGGELRVVVWVWEMGGGLGLSGCWG